MKLNIKKIEICQAYSGLTWKSTALPSSTSPPSTPLVPLISCQNFAALSQSSFTLSFFPSQLVLLPAPLPNSFSGDLLQASLILQLFFFSQANSLKLLSFSRNNHAPQLVFLKPLLLLKPFLPNPVLPSSCLALQKRPPQMNIHLSSGDQQSPLKETMVCSLSL